VAVQQHAKIIDIYCFAIQCADVNHSVL